MSQVTTVYESENFRKHLIEEVLGLLSYGISEEKASQYIDMVDQKVTQLKQFPEMYELLGSYTEEPVRKCPVDKLRGILYIYQHNQIYLLDFVKFQKGNWLVVGEEKD